MPIRIETEHQLSILTDQAVSVKTEGGMTTVTIEGLSLVAPPTARQPEPRPAEPQQPSRSTEPRCGVTMARSGQPCARRKGHNGVHMNAEQVARKQAYNKRRARERYAEDPDYAEHVKAQVRASQARKQGGKQGTG